MPPKKRIVRLESPVPGTSRESDDFNKPFSLPYKPGAFLKLLEGRQLGTVKNYEFPRDVIRMKVQDFTNVQSVEFALPKEQHTIYFLRGGKSAMVSSWFAKVEKDQFSNVTGLLHYDISKVTVGNTKCISSKYRIDDACQAYADPDIFVFIYRDRANSVGKVHVGLPQENDIVQCSYAQPNNKNFWAINSNTRTGGFAVGSDGEVCIYTITGLQEVRELNDNIHSLAYNKRGTTLHMGCDSGDLIVYDLRAENTLLRIKVNNERLDDVLILKDGNYCLCSGVNNRLMKVDLRNKQVVFDFPNHNRRRVKTPVSANEKLNLVTCTSDNHITRIWCLKTGNLLKSFVSPSTYQSRACFVPGSDKGQLYLVQDNFVHIYSMYQ